MSAIVEVRIVLTLVLFTAVNFFSPFFIPRSCVCDSTRSVAAVSLFRSLLTGRKDRRTHANRWVHTILLAGRQPVTDRGRETHLSWSTISRQKTVVKSASMSSNTLSERGSVSYELVAQGAFHVLITGSSHFSEQVSLD